VGGVSSLATVILHDPTPGLHRCAERAKIEAVYGQPAWRADRSSRHDRPLPVRSAGVGQ